MPTPQALGVLLRLDGVVHCSDLPVQSFARHLTEGLPPEHIRPIIAGMRGFLEGKPDLMPTGFDLNTAEDGYQAVEILARTTDLTSLQITAARLASRADLADSAWAVDPPEGLDDLLAELAGPARIAVFTEAGDPAALDVLEAIGIDGQVDELVEKPTSTVVARLLQMIDAANNPGRLLVIGTRWTGELDAASGAGCVTGLIDRYALGRGKPTWRAGDLVGLVGHVREWVRTAGSTIDSRGTRT